MTIAREVMNMSPSTTTGDVSTTESVWNFWVYKPYTPENARDEATLEAV